MQLKDVPPNELCSDRKSIRIKFVKLYFLVTIMIYSCYLIFVHVNYLVQLFYKNSKRLQNYNIRWIETQSFNRPSVTYYFNNKKILHKYQDHPVT